MPSKDLALEISMDDISTDPPAILEAGEEVVFPNLHRFITETGRGCSAKVDIVRFFENETPQIDTNVHDLPWSGADTRPLDPAKGEPETAELFLVENVDARQICHLLDTRVTAANRLSFLAFLDDHLADHPSFNFDDVRHHIAPLPSALAPQQHVHLTYITVREFDRAFPFVNRDIKAAALASGAWRDERAYGSMNPVQRMQGDGGLTCFPPLLVAKTHLDAWFESEPGQPWRTGVILIDEIPRFRGMPAQLRPSYHVVGGNFYSGCESTRDLLSRCMRRNRSFALAGIPAPFAAVQDMYRIIGFEWMRLASYVTRDLNAIEWALQNGEESHHDLSPAMYKSALQSLFCTRRRIQYYCGQIREQLATCRTRGRRSWNNGGGGVDPEHARLADEAADELAGDFAEVEARMAQGFARLEQSISHIAGETTIKEAERTRDQNKILLLLALVGTLFLPVSAVAAIFSMTGDWAPNQPSFGLFWAVCISISLLLVVLLTVVTHWSSIARKVERLRGRRDEPFNVV